MYSGDEHYGDDITSGIEPAGAPAAPPVRSSFTVLADARTRFGFLSAEDLAVLAADQRTRLMRVLVRCGGCRFLAAAQDAKHLIDIITAEGRDYVRDVSLPADGQ